MQAICDRFWLPLVCPAEVKAVDTRILRDERDALVPEAPPLPWVSVENVEPLGVPIVGYPPAEIEELFVSRWAELTDGTFRARTRRLMTEPGA
jgi:hypothetical protein